MVRHSSVFAAERQTITRLFSAIIMAELSVQDKARIAAQLVEQSPPGEVK